MHASFQSLPLLVDSRVNDGLLQTMPDVNKAPLQFIDIGQTTLCTRLFLCDDSDLVVDRVIIYK